MPTKYTLANTGRTITPLEGEICWKPSRDWREFPVRISELADSDFEHDGTPFAFGYLYDTKYDMTEIIIHCVSEMVPRHIKLYKENIYNSIEEYYYSSTYSNPSPPRGIEDFVEIQLEDGDWVSFKTYVRFVVGDPIRYFNIENALMAPAHRENAAPVAFPGGGKPPEEEIWEPAPLRMGANGVVARSISSNPLDYVEDPLDSEDAEEFMTPPTHPPSATSTQCVAFAEVLHEEDDEEEAEPERIVFPPTDPYWAPERDAEYHKLCAQWLKYLYENGPEPSPQDCQIWAFAASKEAEYMLENEIRRLARKSKAKDHYRGITPDGRGPVPRCFTETVGDNIGVPIPIRLRTDTDEEDKHTGVVTREFIQECPLTKKEYYPYLITLDKPMNVNGTEVSSFDSIYQYVEEGKENRFVDCWKHCEVFYEDRWQIADDVRRKVF